MSDRPGIVLVHDYLTQRGGAERVVLSMLKAFPGAPLYTSLYDAEGTFPEFRDVDVRTLRIDRIGFLRRRHRLALPLLAPAFGRLRIDADVVVCSSSGWAHGVGVRGRKVVYCHAPARWLYQSERYLRERGRIERIALGLLRGPLLRWDRSAARSADRYLANSTVVRDRIRDAYGIDAEVVPPPQTIDAGGSQAQVRGLRPGFFLCVSRLLPYKNVDAVIEAFVSLPEERLVVVGTGPDAERLGALASANTVLLGAVSDEVMRWLYEQCGGVVAASYEDYGLTPLEAASFGRPAAVLRSGGFLDTVVPEVTGVFFERPAPADVAAAIRRVRQTHWNPNALVAHADRFSERPFVERLRAIVAEERLRRSSVSFVP